MNFQSRQIVDGVEVLEYLARGEPMFAGLTGDVYLEQHRHVFRRIVRVFVDFLGDRHAVNAVDHAEKTDGIPTFI